MADTYTTKKIDQLTEKTTADDTDLYVLGNQGTSAMRKITFANLAAKIRDKLTTLTFSGFGTTSKTIPGAVNELHGGDFISWNGTIIPSNANLNSYQTPGVYYAESAAKAASLANTPQTIAGFKLIVTGTGYTPPGYIIQLMIIGTASNNSIYRRHYTSTSSTWSDWMNLAKADQDATFAVCTTYADLYEKANKLSSYMAATIYLNTTVLNAISGGAYTSETFRGLMCRASSGGLFDFIGTTGDGTNFVAIRATLGTSAPTLQSLRKVPMSANPLFKATNYTYTYSLAANSNLSITATNFGFNTPSGYTPIATRYFSSGSNVVMIRGVMVSATGANAVMLLRNISSSQVTDAIASVTVIYARTDSI